jgi:hypothetical protein
MTMVRMKVARSEFTFSTPTLAKIAVSAAKTADRSAHTIQAAIGKSVIGQHSFHANRAYLLNKCDVKSWPFLLKSATMLPSLWIWMRKPSNLTSWYQPSQRGGSFRSVGAHGLMKGDLASTAQI